MCLFCKIVNGEIPSYKVYEDEAFIAFLDINPTSKGHVLVVPKTHSDNILNLDEGSSTKLMVVVQKIIKHISPILGTTDFNILNNCGPLAGQTVNHFHVHIIPRYQGDNIEINFVSANVPELDKLAKLLSL